MQAYAVTRVIWIVKVTQIACACFNLRHGLVWESKENREQLRSMANSFSPVSLALLKDAPCTLLLNFIPVEQRTRDARRTSAMNNIKIKLEAYLEMHSCMHTIWWNLKGRTAKCNRFLLVVPRNGTHLNVRSNSVVIRGCLIKYISLFLKGWKIIEIKFPS